MTPRAVIARSPSKLILFGEHAVLYGEPALGIALKKGVQAELAPGTGVVTAELLIDAGAARAAIAAAAATPQALVAAALGDRASRLDTRLRIEVPPAAGLGTSAAVILSSLRALDVLDGRPSTGIDLLEEAIRIEHVAHGRSSGIDPAICISGGMVRFRTDERAPLIDPVRPGADFFIVVGVRGSHGGTKTRVQQMRRFLDRSKKAGQQAMKTLGAASRTGTKAIKSGDLELAGACVDLAHGVLGGLGLVSDSVEMLVRSARRDGALGAKMSGAGGEGGALFALAPSAELAQRIETRWSTLGAISWVQAVSRK